MTNSSINTVPEKYTHGLTLQNVEGIARLLRDQLRGRKFIVVSYNEISDYEPFIRTGVTLASPDDVQVAVTDRAFSLHIKTSSDEHLVTTDPLVTSSIDDLTVTVAPFRIIFRHHSDAGGKLFTIFILP